MQDAKQGTKLPTPKPTTARGGGGGGMLTISSEHRLRQENLPFDIDVWYPSLAAFTFPSYFLPISRTEARAILNYYRTRYMNKATPPFSPRDIIALEKLEIALDALIKQHFHNKGAFLRLCGRSPKDSEPLDNSKVWASYLKELDQLIKNGQPNTANTKMMAISRVSWLKVTNGREALSLILSSERVFADLRDWLDYGEPEQIVLRAFEPELTYDMEFRAFVYDNKLNGISQYDHYSCYKHLPEMKQIIQDAILEFWKQVHPAVGESSYIIDFGYLPQSKRVVLIEISPFLPCTGPACFSWSKDGEKLKHGPFEFRLNMPETSKHSRDDQLEMLIETNWDARWNTKSVNYFDYFAQIRAKYAYQDYLDNLPTRGERIAYFSVLVLVCSLLFTALTRTLLLPLSLFALFALLSNKVISYCRRLARGRQQHPQQQQQQHPNDSFAEGEEEQQRHLLFVYGTLKAGFHWHSKFLSRATFVTAATTVDTFPLVMGECGVPYLLNNLPGKGKRVRGEVWSVSSESLEGLDQYEGISKGHYSRLAIDVEPHNNNASEKVIKKAASLRAFCYFGADSSITEKLKKREAEDLASPPDLLFLSEYTMEMHRKHYQAIRHIQVKQQLYLKSQLTSASS